MKSNKIVFIQIKIQLINKYLVKYIYQKIKLSIRSYIIIIMCYVL